MLFSYTGKYRDGDETKIHPPPRFVAKNFSEAVDFILTLILWFTLVILKAVTDVESSDIKTSV